MSSMFKSFLLVLTLYIILVNTQSSALKVNDRISELFSEFKRRHQKKYKDPLHEVFRERIFARNKKKVDQLNHANKHASFSLVDSKFADLSEEEFRLNHLSALHHSKIHSAPHRFISDFHVAASAPPKYDWRNYGAVTRVKDQGQCGSCWAFSTIGSIEGVWAAASNPLVELSEQQLVSCDKSNEACNGGMMENALDWFLSNTNGQVYTEASFPYTSGQSSVEECKKSGEVGAVINGKSVLVGDEENLSAWLFANGPVAIAVDASIWQFYMSGIVSNCFESQLNHGVLLVGYDNTADTPYWIIKNSWGTNWGESGYIRLEKGKNVCLMNEYTVAPTVEGGGGGNVTEAPTHTPTPGSTVFVQKTCYNSKCSLLCTNESYPTNTCLSLKNGGSSILECKEKEVVETRYETEDCSGIAKTSTMALNKCERSYLAFIENVCTIMEPPHASVNTTSVPYLWKDRLRDRH